MKKLIIVILLVILFGCNQPENTKSKGDSGGTKIKTIIVPEGNLIDGTVQLFPYSEFAKRKNFFENLFQGAMLCAETLQSPEQALDNWNHGIMCMENSYEWVQSVKYHTVNYFDIGTLVGYQTKLLVNVRFKVIEYSNNSNPVQIGIRAKGSTSQWKILNPVLGSPDEMLVVTDDLGVIEWYCEESAYYNWGTEESPNYGFVIVVSESNGAWESL
jgi:hypothetical protein